jgi:protein Mpv17
LYFLLLFNEVFNVFVQFVYWSWLSNSMYHGAMGAMQGQNLEQIYHRIMDVLWETQKAQWVFWIPIQLLNFRFVPVRHQLNVVLLTSIVWTALLSAWYPPQPDEGRAQVEQQAADEKKPIDEKQAEA